MSTPDVAIPQSEEPKAGVARGRGGWQVVRQRLQGRMVHSRAKLETGF